MIRYKLEVIKIFAYFEFYFKMKCPKESRLIVQYLYTTVNHLRTWV